MYIYMIGVANETFAFGIIWASEEEKRNKIHYVNSGRIDHMVWAEVRNNPNIELAASRRTRSLSHSHFVFNG